MAQYLEEFRHRGARPSTALPGGHGQRAICLDGLADPWRPYL